MSIVSKPFNPLLTPAYGGCSCDCHHIEGVHHIVACCHPSEREVFPLEAPIQLSTLGSTVTREGGEQGRPSHRCKRT